MNKHLKYPKMLEPYTLPNGVVLRSHLEASPSGLHFLQGPEPFPTEAVMIHYMNKAKNGAAIVTIHGCTAHWEPNKGYGRSYDITDGHCQQMIALLVNGIQEYGAKAMMRFDPDEFLGTDYDVSTGIPTFFTFGDGSKPRFDKVEAPVSEMKRAAEEFTDALKMLKEQMGFDGVWLHMAYQHDFMGRCLSPQTNKRTDMYGGCLENRVRYPLEVCHLIKEKCGKEFIVEATISAYDAGEGGTTIEDTCRFAHMAEGLIDILQIKGPTIDEAHPIGFHTEIPWLEIAAAVKASNPKVTITSVGGYFFPDTCERVLESGQVDMLAMARSFIADSEYGKKVREGRPEDIVPCVRCNKCHKSSYKDPWLSVCTVNPVMGLEHMISRLVSEPEQVRKVAVIGGGPAGMQSALYCAQRGHCVTLFEKAGHLGGQLNVTREVPFKWPLQKFREYLIRQVEKSPIQVRLNAKLTPEKLEIEGFDAVIAAVGAVPAELPIPGADGKNVSTAIYAYEHPDAIGERVIIIGGGEVGVETGIYFSRMGKKITVLEMGDEIAPDSTPVHYMKMFRDEWMSCKTLDIRTNARAKRISADGVTYQNVQGKDVFLAADSVIIAAGMKACTAEALLYADCTPQFFMVGDCRKVGNVQKCLRSALLATARI